MPGDRLIGEAWISILADGSLFRSSADAEMKRALTGLRGKIPITADMSDVDKKVTALAAALKGLDGKVQVGADTRRALVDVSNLQAELEALAARAADIPLDLNDSKGLAKVYTMMASIDDLAKQAEDMDADFNINRAIAKFYTLEAGVKALDNAAQNMRADFDQAQAEGKLAVLTTSVEKIAHELSSMRADVTDSAMVAKIVGLQSQALKLAHTLRDMPITANMLPIEADLFKLAAQVEAIRKSLDLKVGATVLPAKPGAYQTFGMTGLNASDAQNMDALTVQTLAAMTAFKSFNSQLKDTNTFGLLASAGLAKIAATQTMLIAGNGGGWWGALTTHIRLFGGALDGILPKFLQTVSVWHLGLDVILEFAAAWGPALIAVGTFAAYAIPVGEKIYGQWKNINTILDGVGGKLPDLGSSFDTITRAIEPSILEAFGEYMMVIGRNAVPLGEALAKVGQVVDVWGAKLVGWASSAQKSFDNIVGVGAKDFAQLGYAFSQVFKIIGSLIKDLPGFVHIFLTMGDAILTVAANAVAALGPLLRITLWAHGVLLYVGLATTAIIALGRAMAAGAIASFAARTGAELTAAGTAAAESSGKFSKFGLAIGTFAGSLAGTAVNIGKYVANIGGIALGSRAVATGLTDTEEGLARVASRTGPAAAGSKLFGDAMAAIPFGPVGLGIAALAVGIGVGLYFAFRNSTDAADKFSAQIKNMITASNAANISANLTKGITESIKQLDTFNKTYANLIGNVNARGGGVWATGEQQKYIRNVQQAVGYTQTYAQRLGALAIVFGSTGAAESALALTGSSIGKVATENNATWQTQYIELQALAKGYGYMGSQAGAAGAQLNTLNIASGTVTKNIQTLVSAEQAWITLITGGQSAFTGFEQGFAGLSSAMGKTAAGAPTVSVTIGKLRQTFTALGGTMSGTSASSLAVQQAFDQQLSAGVTLYGNLQTLAGASGNTAKANTQLAKSGKDIIAQLLPFAAGSRQATAEVSALAQIMGGPATDNFQVLAKWVGSTRGAEADLNKQQAALTISSANLSVAAKNLGNALLTDVTNMEAAKTASATIEGAVNGLFKSFQQGKGQVTDFAVSMAGQYVTALKNAHVGTQQATQMLNAYLQQLGYGPKAIALIDSSLGQSVAAWNKQDQAVAQNTKATAAMVAATNNNRNSLAALNGLLPLTTNQFNILWGAITKEDQILATTGRNAGAAKSAFIDFATHGLGVAISKAQDLWAKFGQQNLDYLATHASATKNSFIQFAENGLHLTSSQAKTLWGEFALQNLDVLASKGTNAKNKFIDLARNGLNLSNSAAQNLWTTLTHQYLDTVAAKAHETEGNFIKTAAAFGIARNAAILLWNELHQIPANVNTNVHETLSGSGAIKAAITAQSLTLSSSGAATQAANLVGVAAPHKAGGGILGGPGPAGKDSSLFWGAPGELVIPTTHAAAHMVQAKREGIPIPAHAAGGVVTGSAQSTLANVQQGVTTAQSGQKEFTADAMKLWLAQLNSAFTQAQGAAGGKYGGPTSFGGGFESLAALVSFARYFMQNGLNMAAAAGMAATISGEENSLGPESVGSGGFGLIGWTGNTIGLPPGYHGPTGNVAYDLSAQLAGVIGYMNSRGGAGPLNAAGSPIAAGNVWSRYEAPLVPLSDTRPAIANEIYAALGGGGAPAAQANLSQGIAKLHGHQRGGVIKPYSGGGMISEPVLGYGMHSGTPYSFAENGQPEFVSDKSPSVAAQPGMPGATNIGQQTLINQNNTMIKLLQQLPLALGQAVGTAGGNGVRHGYYGAQN